MKKRAESAQDKTRASWCKESFREVCGREDGVGTNLTGRG